MIKNNSFIKFLDKKVLYYDKIDYDVINKSWEILSKYINLPYVIHIVGTNGKGSTGRYIASFLYQNNKSVLHYSSPHILNFNERIWINGYDSSNKQLQKAHEILQDKLDIYLLEKLTYFEYTTLLALVLSNNIDYLVLEAGLGGEFDATNVVKNDLSVIPSIGLDHIEFLGNTISKIATTKLKSCDNNFILGIDMHKDVISVKNNILKDKNEIIINKNISLPNESNNLPIYLQNNLILAINVINYLNININNIKLVKLFGRCQKIANNITIDVGHNTLAANVLLKEYKNKNIILIYNSYIDKDYNAILNILKPIIYEVHIISCDDNRVCKIDYMKKQLDNLNILNKEFNYNNISNDFEYLVFGSFKVVEEFLKIKDKFEK